jgi:hypothetical protein
MDSRLRDDFGEGVCVVCHHMTLIVPMTRAFRFGLSTVGGETRPIPVGARVSRRPDRLPGFGVGAWGDDGARVRWDGAHQSDRKQASSWVIDKFSVYRYVH